MDFHRDRLRMCGHSTLHSNAKCYHCIRRNRDLVYERMIRAAPEVYESLPVYAKRIIDGVI